MAETVTTTTARSTQQVQAFHLPRVQQCQLVRSSTSTARQLTITTLSNQIQFQRPYACASCSVSLSLPSLSKLKFAKNDNTDETNSLIWFQLVNPSNGNPYKNTGATTVSTTPGSFFIVDQFRDAVKAKYVDSHLIGVAPSDLLVYKNKAAFDAKDDPLKVSASLKGLGIDDEDNALIVVVPSFRQQVGFDKDEKWSDWYAAICNAKPKLLSSDDKWATGSNLIQIKRMTVSDLPFHAIPESIEDYNVLEKSLDVIKLPLPIPISSKRLPSNMIAPDILFVRPDEYILFHLMNQYNVNDVLLLGNPGISKSWFHFKFILFWSRPDIYMTLRTPPPIPTTINDPSNQVQSPCEPGLLTNVNEQVNDLLFNRSLQECFKEMQTVLGCRRPKKILRTVGGDYSYLFRDNEVFYNQHPPASLKSFVDENDVLLWEPGNGKQPVEYDMIMARIIATVSPNTQQYKHFERQGPKMFYMPCPSEVQLQLMGQIFRLSVPSSSLPFPLPSSDIIHYRYLRYGPYIQPVLTWPEDTRLKYARDQSDEIEGLSQKIFESYIAINMHVEATGNVYKGLSYRLARYAVDRATCNYSNFYFAVSCEYVLTLLSKKVYTSRLDHVMSHLTRVNQEFIDLKEFIPYYLERVVALHACSEDGLQWSIRPHEIRYSRSTNKQTQTWSSLKLKVVSVREKITKFSEMQQQVLYHPKLSNFPLVDMYWKNEDNELCAILVTSAEKHSKTVSEYDNFFNYLGCNTTTIKLNLYILILPIQIEKYESTSVSKFWSNSTLEPPPDHYQKNVKFHILVPPDDFSANMSLD